MPHVKRLNQRQRLSIALGAILLMAIFCYARNIEAAGLQIGTSTLNLGATENILYGQIGASSNASSSFLLFQKGATDIFKVRQDGLTYISGKLGVQTTNPLSNLHVVGSGGVGDSAFLANYGNDTVLGEISFVSHRAGFWNTLYINESGNSATNAIYVTGNKPIIFNAVNVGIGLTNPGAKLEVSVTNKNEAIRLTSGGYINFSSTNDGPPSATDMTGAKIVFYKSASNSLNSYSIGEESGAMWFNTLGAYRWYQGNATPNMILNGSGYLGIGTTNPGAKLEVVPSSGYSILAGNYKIGNVALPTATADAATKGYVDSAIATATSTSGMPSGTAGQTLRHDGASWVASSLLYNSGTNVGVGTTDPTTKLTLGNTASVPNTAAARISVYSDAGSTFGMGLAQYNSVYGLGLYANGIAAAPHVFINASGNVGIGSTNPAVLLELNTGSTQGSLVTTSTNSGIRITDSSSSAGARKGLSFYSSGAGSPGIMGGIETNVVGGWDTHMDFFNRQGGNITNALHLDESGNVGIGSTAPGAKLQVDYSNSNTSPDTSSYGIRIKNTAWGGSQISGIEFWNGNNKAVATSRIISQMNGSGNEGDNLIFQTQPTSATNPNPNQPTTKMVILADGNIGIGATNPGAKLEVIPSAGYSILAGNYKIGNVALPTANSDAATKGYVDSAISTATSSISSLWSGTLNGNIWNGAAGAGNVGIGTTNPRAKLEVSGGSLLIPFDQYLYGNNAGTGNYSSINLYNGATGAMDFKTVFGSNGAGFTYTTYAGEKMRLTGDGKLGLGTSAPNFLLEANGVIASGGSGAAGELRAYQAWGAGSPTYYLSLMQNSNKAGIFIKNVDNSIVYYNTSTGGTYLDSASASMPVILAINGAEKMRLASDGNVGIGTSTPSAKLEVLPSAGYSILAGNYKIGNVALPTANADAATKGYVDSAISTATSSISNLWSGTLNGSIWNGAAGAGNVGLGTTNPGAKLEIAGNQIIRGTGTAGSAGTTTLTFSPTIDGGASQIQVISNFGPTNSTNYSSGFKFVTSNFSPYASVDALAIRADGKIGIGTTAPTKLLHLFASSTNPTELIIENTGSTGYTSSNIILKGNGPSISHEGIYTWNAAYNKGWFFGNPFSGDGFTVNYQAGAFNVNTADVSKSLFFVGSGGNIGIGTTSPSVSLHILRPQAELLLVSQGTGWGDYSDAKIQSANGQNGIIKIYGDTYNDTTLRNVFEIGTGVAGGQVRFVSAAGAEAARINASGYLGLGTTTPSAKLEVVPSSGYSILAGNYKIGNVALPTATSDAATKGYVDSAIATATSSGGLPAGVSGQTLRHNGSTWAADSLLFNSSTNIGIGTTNPVNLLTVKPSTPDLGITVQESDSTNNAVRLNGNDTSGYVKVYANNAEVIRLGGNGDSFINTANIGIGTTNPDRKLTVSDSSVANTYGKGINLVRSDASTSGTTLSLSWLSSNSWVEGAVGFRNLGTGGSGDFYIATRDAGGTNNLGEAVTVTKAGNVGIGTTAPNFKLDVTGTLGVSGNTNLGNSTSGETLFLNGKNGTSYSYNLSTSLGNYLSIKSTLGGATDFVIDSNGSLGLGTTSPSSKLEVVPASGYSILAGNFKIGNVALPTANADAATKGYVDSSIAAATSSIGSLWAGTMNGNIWNGAAGAGNVGVGITNPTGKLHVVGTTKLSSGGASGVALEIASGDYIYLPGASGNVYMRSSGGGLEFVDGSFNALGNFAGSASGRNSVLNNQFSVGVGVPSASDPHALRVRGTSASNNWYKLALFENSNGDPVLFMQNDGNVGIGLTNPSYKLDVNGIAAFRGYNTFAQRYGFWNGASGNFGYISGPSNGVMNLLNAAENGFTRLNFGPASSASPALAVNSGDLQVIKGDGSTAANLLVTGGLSIATTTVVSKQLTLQGDAVITGALTVGNLSVDKLTANTIDPLYNINGTNYSTFASSIAGGVKEEYVGHIRVAYRTVINFDKAEEGSDLWLWRQVVDFSRDNVDVLMTPYGNFAETWYEIKGNSIVFRSDRPVDISFRLVGKRLDWRQWPTRAEDQKSEGFKISNK